jgi:hypothetical protein
VLTQLSREQRIRYGKFTSPNGGHEMEGWEWIGEGEDGII